MPIPQNNYSEEEVKFLLQYYLQYRSNLLDPMAVPNDNGPPTGWQEVKNYQHEMPLGHTQSASPWPFMVKRSAQKKPDGKRRASKEADMHVAMVDLENGMRCLTDNYLEVIYKYYLFQLCTLEELAAELQLSFKSSAQNRCNAAIRALTRHMNSGGRPAI